MKRGDNLQVPCPVCRQPFQSPAGTLPVNFVIQNVIDVAFQSIKGICRVCFIGERRLQLATMRCLDCKEDFCNSCTEDSHQDHCHTSLLEKRCDKHQQKLELYCITCRTNICVLCFSEVHQSHECDAVDKLTEKHADMLVHSLEKLIAMRTAVHAALMVVSCRMWTCRKHWLDLQTFTQVTDKKIRAIETDLQLEETSGNSETSAIAQSNVVYAVIGCNTNARATNQPQDPRNLQQNVCVLLSDIVVKLQNEETRLHEVRSNITKLETRANDIISNRSTSRVTDTCKTICRIQDEVNSLLSAAQEYQFPQYKSK